MSEKRCYGCMQLRSSESAFCEHCGYDAQAGNAIHQLPAGTVLKDQYLIGKVLGQGGFGITYLGWDQYLNIPLAIKEYYPSGTVMRDSTVSIRVTNYDSKPDSTFISNRDRFLKEAQTLARLSNVPEVVQVKNFFLENNTAYIVMEYVQGTNLRTYVQSRGGRLTAEESLSILKPIVGALQKVHKTGLVHRDISPDNIMLLPGGGVKLLDFGAVRDVGNATPGADMPKSTMAILKQGFAPIEQYQRRGSLGPWTDVYALCATVYYCMTGDVPVDAPERLLDEADLKWETLPGLTSRQAKALEHGMALFAKQRTASMEELYHELFDEAVAEVQPASQSYAPTEPVSIPQSAAPVTGYQTPVSQIPATGARPYPGTQPLEISEAQLHGYATTDFRTGVSQQGNPAYRTGMGAQSAAGYQMPAGAAPAYNTGRGYAGTLPLEMPGDEGRAAGYQMPVGQTPATGARPYPGTQPLEMPQDAYRTTPATGFNAGYQTGMGNSGVYGAPVGQPVPGSYPPSGQNAGFHTVPVSGTGGSFTAPLNPQTTSAGYSATEPVRPVTGDQPAGGKKKKSKGLIAGIAAVIAVVVGLAAFFGIDRTNYAETNILMTDAVYVDPEAQDEAYDAPVFGNGELRRRDIVNVFFVDNLEDVKNGWDVSAAGNNMVRAEAVYNGNGTYDLYIGGKNGVWASGDTLEGLFAGYCNLIHVSFGDGNLHTENATSMAGMFEYCAMLREVDLSTFNTANVTNMSFLFNACINLQSVNFTGFNTARVTNMNHMFRRCESLREVDLSSFNTTNVTTMEAMFDYCISLEYLDLSNFDTSSVTNMGWMFDECNALTYLNISSFDTSFVTNMYAMFANCLVLEELDVSHFNTRAVTDMGFMFFGCEVLTELDVSGFDTSRVTNMEDMFGWCCKVRYLDVSGFDTRNVTNMKYMFYCCESLTATPDVSNFNTSRVTNYENFMDPNRKVDGRAWKYLF